MGIFKLMLGKPFDDARKIAPKIIDEAMASQEMNPSTRLHELLAFFEELSSPRKITPTP